MGRFAAARYTGSVSRQEQSQRQNSVKVRSASFAGGGQVAWRSTRAMSPHAQQYPIQAPWSGRRGSGLRTAGGGAGGTVRLIARTHSPDGTTGADGAGADGAGSGTADPEDLRAAVVVVSGDRRPDSGST